jgi:chromosome segregation protein
MRLTHIKLAGFKTFVDPTTISTPGQLVGIVGPNGCGKSNVIDAVRWVLGESRAGALRGDSMQDVIFNGAGDRKPVSRASVELQFDNSDGRIGGQWGQYSELSLKRVLTREGDSGYYINNIPVRRRDIYDVFLGTGLGPRSYAIIEQGMISRVVEAKPEELRVYLEEAAGVSKYKERRKETESRLKDTRQNMSRLEDIRGELGSQLSKLEAQAAVAAQFHELEDHLKITQQLSWFSKQQEAKKARDRASADAQALAAQLEAAQAAAQETETRLETLRNEHYAANDALHDKQGAFYAVSTEVSRLEEQLKSAHASESRIKQQAEQINAQIAELDSQTVQAGEDEAQTQSQLEEAAMMTGGAEDELSASQEDMPALETAVAQSQQVWMETQSEVAQLEESAHLSQQQRDHAQKQIDALRARRERLEAELNAMDGAPGAVSVADVEEQLAQENEALASLEGELAESEQSLEELAAASKTAQSAWQASQKALDGQTARAQALSALNTQVERPDVKDWAEKHAMDSAARLWQKLDIEEGWEDALESVLADRFNALEVDDFGRAAEWIAEGDGALPQLTLFTAKRDENRAPAQPAPDALFYKLQIKDSHFSSLLADLLYGVHCAESVEDALKRRNDLAPGASFVTREGHRVTAQSVSFFAPDANFHGVLSRSRELAELDSRIAEAEAAATEARRAMEEAESAVADARQQIADSRSAMASQQKRCHALDLELAQLRKEEEAKASRRARINADIDGIRSEEAAAQEQLEEVASEIAEAQMKLNDAMAKRDALRAGRNEADVALERGRERLRLAEHAVSEAKYAERSLRERLQELARRKEQLARQKEQQTRFLNDLTRERANVDWAEIERQLQEQLAKRAEAEQILSDAREKLENLANTLRETEDALHANEANIEPARNQIQDMRLKEQAAQLQEQQFTEQLSEAGADLEALPAKLAEWGKRSLNAEIDRVQKAIAALGAVNLAALDELNAATERKTYLDKQADDLTEAIETLENAIRQIDKESRELLKGTFDTVNANFSKLFPALFGGGQGRLELTGEEILDSGVQLIAQPPGKRNASIQILSGGEKTLTATALVFAIFQLNPAPFCLLDEVDAPLDDSNTVRFCNLVRTMSDNTQFLFITHNKIVMELASQLVGITMPDPGVTRVVAVDIEQAVDLAKQNAAAMTS